MIYKMTSKCQIGNLASGQGYDLTRKGHVVYHWIRLDETNSMNLSQSKVIAQKLLVTCDDVT